MLLFGLGDILSPIKTWFQSLLENLVFRIFYILETLILRFVKLVEDTMMIFTGEKLVKYDTKDTTLIDVFFNHGTAKSIYTGIAITGIMIAFAFAIIAVVRKIGDLRDKQQGVTMGTIIGNLLKSVLLIVGMNAIMIVAIGTSNILVTSIGRAFSNYKSYINENNSIVFKDEHYAAMGRIINKLGNYSLNPSYRSRYNLNACYNDIRKDLQYLGDEGVVPASLWLAARAERSPSRKVVRVLGEDEILLADAMRRSAVSPLELRDAAIVALGLTMGLRSCDVLALEMSSIS